jgi:hypothetical protein
MTVNYSEVLRQKRSEVLREIEELRATLVQTSARIASKESQVRNLEDLLAIEQEPNRDQSPINGAASPRTGRIPDDAFQLLSEAGSPLHYREIARRLTSQGIHIPGKDPAANLLTQISRDQRFGRTHRRGTYGLREWPSLQAARPVRRAKTSAKARSRA